jgi:Protein of unknown function (DUF3617)
LNLKNSLESAKISVESTYACLATNGTEICALIADVGECVHRCFRDQTGGIMRRTRRWITLVGCLFEMAVFAPAQTRKPGLWALTTTTTWQQSPFPAGVGDPTGDGAHTTQVCVTQQYFDKYGAILPQISGCRATNLAKKANGMTADMECTGRMSGKGSLASSWTDDEHATGKVHFVGSMQVGPNNKPIEWTTASSSIYKGIDCGSVKPLSPLPGK